MELGKYEFLIVDGVSQRDGIGIEVWANDNLILEIFRDDSEKTKTITFYKKDIPLDLMEESIQYFKRNNLSDFID